MVLITTEDRVTYDATPSSTLTGFGEWLVDRAVERGYLMSNFADACQVTHRTLNYWMTGRQYPSALNAARIASVLEVPVEDVIMAIIEDSGEDIRL